MANAPLNSKLDLKLERVIDVLPELVWEAWTTPEHLKAWFCPKPWQTTEAEIDLRPGGKFRTVMAGPNGERHDSTGCFLELIPNRKIVFTDALGENYRPNANSFMTAIVLIEPHGNGTKYTAIAMHADEATRQKHEAMGFSTGWATALDQMIAFIKSK